MNPSRRGDAALAATDNAGTMASRNGRARVAPTPRKNVRRGSAIFVMIMSVLSCQLRRSLVNPESLIANLDPRKPQPAALVVLGRRRTHLKWCAIDDAQNQR